MTLSESVMWLTVVGVGFPAAFYNRTALALCGSWLLGEVVWMATGNNLPVAVYFVLDYLVLLVIFTKPEICDMSPYCTFREQIRALWKERSLSDVIVAGIFPLMWIVYVADIGDFYRWWVLWGLVQLQFLAAGWEAYFLWKKARGRSSDRETPGMFRLGLADHG